jgi:hypothetical protein
MPDLFAAMSFMHTSNPSSASLIAMALPLLRDELDSKKTFGILGWFTFLLQIQ